MNMATTITGQQLADLAKTKIGHPYIWGAQGQDPLTRADLDWLVRRYGISHYVFGNFNAYLDVVDKKLQAFDCSSLVNWCLHTLGANFPGGSHGANWFKQNTGRIKYTDLQPGDLCYLTNAVGFAGHVAIFEGDNWVVQAAGTLSGVIRSHTANRFQCFGRLKCLTMVQPTTPAPTLASDYPLLKLGTRNPQYIVLLQTKLHDKGFNPGLIDGKFGKLTLAAVKAFQGNNGLVIDGEVGPKTWSALLGV
jgi:hypothetical protein